VIAEELITDKGVSAGDEWITVAAPRLREALAALKEDGYRLLVFLSCVDHLADSSREWPARFELLYELRDMEKLRDLRVRAFVDGDPPQIDSVHGHPALTRILMPDDWVGHPLRRDYPVGGEPVEFSEEHETWLTPPTEA